MRERRFLWIFGLCVLAACGQAASQSQPDGDAGSPDDDGGTGTDSSIITAHDGSTKETGASTDATTTSDAVTDAPFEASRPTHAALRIMSANITSGNLQSYEAPGIRIFQGLNPDVVLIQEFKYAAGSLRTLVDTAFGPTFSYYVETRVGGIPNGIVSRYPILDSGTWLDTHVSDRAYVWARIDVPGPTDLWAISLHLLTTGITQRDAEANELIGLIQANIPPGDFLTVGGDLNTDAVDESALLDLANVVVVAAPYPVDNAANPNTSTNRNRPHDWVLASSGLDSLQVPVSIGASSFPSGLVFDSRVYTPISEVAPILATDSAVAGMQHMPVIRDFMLVPADGGADAAADANDADAL